jgi:hypothetical protein
MNDITTKHVQTRTRRTIMKHVITVSDGDIVELVPQHPDASTKEDTAGFAAQFQSIPGAPADLSRRVGVIISCPPLPGPPVMLQGGDVQGFRFNVGDQIDGEGSAGNNTYTAGIATGIVIGVLLFA